MELEGYELLWPFSNGDNMAIKTHLVWMVAVMCCSAGPVTRETGDKSQLQICEAYESCHGKSWIYKDFAVVHHANLGGAVPLWMSENSMVSIGFLFPNEETKRLTTDGARKGL